MARSPKEAQEALAEAMAPIGGHSNSGEGAERYGASRTPPQKQVVSGRFWVTPTPVHPKQHRGADLSVWSREAARLGVGGGSPGSSGADGDPGGLDHSLNGQTGCASVCLVLALKTTA